MRKNAPPPGGHVFQATLLQDMTWTNLLTKFHDDRTINIASRVLTRKNATPPWWPYIIRPNHLTKFHDNRKINVISSALIRKNAPPPATETILELIKDIVGTNPLTQFHLDRKINVASRVLTRLYYSRIII
ncbi:hypothetical protein DPMN_042589 [Dreissena polymorpha]|uniref:Uncharacterized protein n=1 Tax=Dreissena polymorpha TaxID=45954 RepID=A0A9D4HX16_DREPO|nr:hypothetical protein DPMN_042589 [Dreissena polymorpha]